MHEMVTTMPDALEELAARAKSRAAALTSWGGPHVEGFIETDPQYNLAITQMQTGRWQEAARLIAILARRYPDSPDLHELRELLALHVSAEETWAEETLQPTRPARRLVRALLIANGVLLALAALALLALYSRLLPLPW